MRLDEVKRIIQEPDTYRVYFFTRKRWDDQRDGTGGYNRDKEDFFPARDEPAFTLVSDAHELTKKFAHKTTDRFFDVHVRNERTKVELPGTYNSIDAKNDYLR